LHAVGSFVSSMRGIASNVLLLVTVEAQLATAPATATAPAPLRNVRRRWSII